MYYVHIDDSIVGAFKSPVAAELDAVDRIRRGEDAYVVYDEGAR